MSDGTGTMYHADFLKVPLGRRAEAPISLQASSTQEGA